MKEEQRDYNVYIVLTRTRTKVARLIRLYTKDPYSHVSISFDDDLSTLYSFARRKIHNPLDAGFIEEHIDSGIFGRDTEITCAVYQLKLRKEQYVRIKELVSEFLQNPMEYGYNFRGLFSAAFNRPYTKPKQFFCSQYVAWLLGTAGVQVISKKYALTRPEDFRQNLNQYMIYEGRLHQYVKNMKERIKVESEKENDLFHKSGLVMS